MIEEIEITNKYIVQALPGIHFRHLWQHKVPADTFSWFEGSKTFMIHRARTGIAVFADMIAASPKNEILVPSYNCGMEIDPFFKTGASVVVYRINKRAEPDIEDIKRKITSKTNVVYVTHYFGLLHNLEELNKICKEKGILLFEDCALSLLSKNKGIKAGEIGDLAVFSFSKSLPVSDGGALVVNRDTDDWDDWRLEKPGTKVLLKGFIPLLKSSLVQRSMEWFPKQTFAAMSRKVGERITVRNAKGTYPEIPADYYYDRDLNNRSISNLSRRVIQGIDIHEVVSSRRTNFKRLLAGLRMGSDFRSLYSGLPEGVCPLFFPVLTTQRDAVCQKLRKSGVAAIPFWSGFHRSVDWEQFPEAVSLKNSILALPIHQDLSENQIKYMIDLINNLQKTSWPRFFSRVVETQTG